MVNRVCQFLQSPTDLHMAAVKRILRYIQGTLDVWLQFHRSSSLAPKAFSDADWAEIIWVESVLREHGIKQKAAAVLWCDNLGAMYLSANPMFHAHMKHVEVDYHFVPERVAKGLIDIRFISTKDQVADGFTKAISA
jgi:hypothetical protein